MNLKDYYSRQAALNNSMSHNAQQSSPFKRNKITNTTGLASFIEDFLDKSSLPQTDDTSTK
jgi:hypothetical protein